ncbi:MAG: tRNA uridine-5-carboxymethylaminomethyl(34) synthesis GTPase MnmE [Bacteroidetes bacterium]|nr:tRNA uridine-5-carboxymethylaminomethyl(34) synthesis GTPase MnmE [Bacteroidota bacterium]
MAIKINQNDTICAVSTSFGVAAISVIRLSGSEALQICKKIFESNNKSFDFDAVKSHSLHLVKIINTDNSVLDEALISVFKNPHSYTGEDIVEISCHGSIYIQEQLMQLLIKNGARTAQPGEFTLRAFLNGKMDLAQAEAVADLISSKSETSHKLALQQMKGGVSKQIKQLRNQLIEISSLLELELDFSEEDIEFANRDKLSGLLLNIKKEVLVLLESYSLGNVLKTGIPVAIIGKPNVGKSTLLNILLNEDRAIVSEIPGTTRDIIEDSIIINGICFRFIDTAGLREAQDEIESVGIEKTYQKIELASIILYMFDVSETGIDEIKETIKDFREKINDKDKKLIIIGNKIDNLIETPKGFKDLLEFNTIFISAKRRENINLIVEKLVESVSSSYLNTNDAVITNSRHYEALNHSQESIESGIRGLEDNISNDLLAENLRAALYYLGEITGDISNEEVLENIFSNFCIGK